MFAENQARYPKGTYKVSLCKKDLNTEFVLSNLTTGLRSRQASVWEFIKTIENDISANRFPQSGIQYRSWVQANAGGQAAAKPAEHAPAGQNDGQSNGPTFILHVLYRQNATWQGTLRWIEGRQTRAFRSVNELLRLMDEAIWMSPEPAAQAE